MFYGVIVLNAYSCCFKDFILSTDELQYTNEQLQYFTNENKY